MENYWSVSSISRTTDSSFCKAPIPDEPGNDQSSISFDVLKSAQALGDGQALIDAGRKVIRFHLDSQLINGLNRILESVTSIKS